MKHRIFLNKFIKLNDYFFIRVKTSNGYKFIKKRNAKRFPDKNLDLFISSRKLKNNLEFFYVCEAVTGLRITKYSRDKKSVILQAKKVLKQRSLSNIVLFIDKHKCSPRYTKIIKTRN